MSRSASDATRFTSATPHASSILQNAGPSKPSQQRRPGETPQERVRRLRAAADKARQAQMSPFDRWIARGRVWADVAHTITTSTLIAASVIAGGVTIYALTDMIIYNRRKKAQFFEEQKAKLELAIVVARQAIREGTATEQQINFIKMEDEHRAAEEAKKLNSTLSSKISKSKDWLFSGLKLEEASGNEIHGDSKNEKSTPDDFSTASREKTSSGIVSQSKQAFADEKQRLSSNSGSSERSAAPAVEDGDRTTSRGWFSWITR
ncbi:hypothetical protein K3495_g8651 [Podosphaera aphanis]|nr:hypothetical protein K3495_g8651 [Podosphaera aphanis]